jgi:hypothetical protein
MHQANKNFYNQKSINHEHNIQDCNKIYKLNKKHAHRKHKALRLLPKIK